MGRGAIRKGGNRNSGAVLGWAVLERGGIGMGDIGAMVLGSREGRYWKVLLQNDNQFPINIPCIVRNNPRYLL